jgi:mannose-1-phosphate guanylyltransferase/mannose-6-phosphate isomerase
MTQIPEILPVILAGGFGTRLWPLSRHGYPKQFLALFTENSLFQDTLKRLNGIERVLPPLVICNDEHRFIVAEQAKNIGHSLGGILLEPQAKNTAPAIALAALKAIANGQDPLLLVLPSDHIFSEPLAFHAAVDLAAYVAQSGLLVTFGIIPTRPETGYGYIKAGLALNENVFKVERFVEKPDSAKAQNYLDAGDYFWNSGMFLFHASAYLDELGKHQPEIIKACQLSMEHSVTDRDFCRVSVTAFAACPSFSVDYAVMEKTSLAAIVPLEAGWNDVGAWPAVREASTQDPHGNSTRGDVLLEDARNNYINAQSRLVCVLGLENITLIETSDVVLVMHHDRSQDVKKIVDTLKKKNRTEAIWPRKVVRPWGSYDAIDEGHRYKVKRIIVNPGEKLSLQMHHHRAEHWIVVSGTALVTVEGQQQLVTENQSTYIPLGHIHRLENPGKVDLHMIEVQSGTYLGEDDIVRLEDAYGRTFERN